MQNYDVVVIGAGFGGLGAALKLAECGARVGLVEQLNYPGGCASTFRRKGHHFEAGATLFSGFGQGQLFERWIASYQLPLTIDFIDPLVVLRTPGLEFTIGRDRQQFERMFLAVSGAPQNNLKQFFAYQKKVAQALWGLLDDPSLLPPFGFKALGAHIYRSVSYGSILRAVGHSMSSVLSRFGLAQFAPLSIYLDALCQITLQCSHKEAEAPFALAAMDYYFRGTGHVRGGIGRLAEGLVSAIRTKAGEVQFANRVKGLEQTPSGWVVHTRRGQLRAPSVIANLLPQNLGQILSVKKNKLSALDQRARAVEEGWGAAMLYKVLNPSPAKSSSAQHYELISDPKVPFIEGNHVFCSVSGSGDDPSRPHERTMTASTHIPMKAFLARTMEERAEYIASVQARMHRTLAELAPEWQSSSLEFTASPRTFERFTGRLSGYVGGIPRRKGLHHYFDLIPSPVAPGLYLVGDSVFPGQSTLATALGGVKVAERILRRKPRRRASMLIGSPTT